VHDGSQSALRAWNDLRFAAVLGYVERAARVHSLQSRLMLGGWHERGVHRQGGVRQPWVRNPRRSAHFELLGPVHSDRGYTWASVAELRRWLSYA
jgi:hypothetical protein